MRLSLPAKALSLSIMAISLTSCADIMKTLNMDAPSAPSAAVSSAQPVGEFQSEETQVVSSGIKSNDRFDAEDLLAKHLPEVQQAAPRSDRSNQDLLAQKTYHFGFDDAQISQHDRAAILAQARYLSAHPSEKVLLAGNTDSRGSREYNIALGWRRSQSIEHLLLLNGVRRSQIHDVSYGFEKPISSGHDEESYRLNRRVELTYEA